MRYVRLLISLCKYRAKRRFTEGKIQNIFCTKRHSEYKFFQSQMYDKFSIANIFQSNILFLLRFVRVVPKDAFIFDEGFDTPEECTPRRVKTKRICFRADKSLKTKLKFIRFEQEKKKR